MRISTSQIYATGVQGMQRNQAALLKLQNQISSNTKILTPADDPIGASQVLVVSQSLAVEEQHQTNQSSATSQLSLVDNQLASLTSALQTVRDSVMKAGNGSLTNTDRQSIANDIESSLSEILGIANSDNGTGDFLFSGYQGGTRPFAVDTSQAPQPPASSSPIAYFGDDGERLAQVSSSRQMAVNVPGSDVFMNGKSGNGTFVATTGGNGGGNNQGSATIDAGSVTDTQQWQLAVDNTHPTTGAGQPIEIRFSVDATHYTIYDPIGGETAAQSYMSGQAISLVTANNVNFGAQVVVTGTPNVGDTFSVTPSSSQSVFLTMQNLIGILRSPVGTASYSTTQLTNDLAGQLTNIDQAMLQVSNVQSAVGSNERELDSLASASSDLVIQYKATLSGLQDLDYNKTFSDYTQQQVSLEAAQKSFVQISGLSLFKYI